MRRHSSVLQVVPYARAIVATVALLGSLPTATFGQAKSAASSDKPPAPQREFRAVWVATVENIDWPSRRGLSGDQQQRELIAIFDKCVELNLNAVILQIRTQADAFYPSKLEPWSEFLSGQMGKPPEPYYDPLELAVKEAHARGLQLHVWFNPYRVRVPGAKGQASPNHASIANADVVRKYGKYLWFDPGEPAAEEQFIAVLGDVVKRYDIDGVHIDDYFYPYQVKDEAGKVVPFPDDDSYNRAQGKLPKPLSRDDWRRQNVDHLIKRMYDEVKKAKPWVLVGISPFGIWRPGNPPGVVGLDQYSTLYADARKWEREGWLDYLTPQLYWQVESKGQPYGKLLGWWSEQNVKERHLWPGNFTSKIQRKRGDKDAEATWHAEDILRQIEVTRKTPGATGNVHFSMKAFLQDRDGINEKLKKGFYAEPALVPESPWLGDDAPAKPTATARRVADGIELRLKPAGKTNAAQWLVQTQTDNGWKTAVLPGSETKHALKLDSAANPLAIVITGVSRLGRTGQPARVTVEK